MHLFDFFNYSFGNDNASALLLYKGRKVTSDGVDLLRNSIEFSISISFKKRIDRQHARTCALTQI
jgi:hypothetical protein